MPDFIERCGSIEGATVSDGVFTDGQAVWVGKREVAHAEEDGVVDIRLTKAVIRADRETLKGDPRVTLRRSASDWLEFTIASAADADDAFRLVERAVAANRPTAKPGPPPTGAELERRRRFH